MEDLWLASAKRLQALAATGLHFASDPYDQERFEEIAALAETLLGAIGEVPADRIRGLLPDFAQGYVTPKIDVRGAVISDGHVLLVRELSDGLWTLPGGYAEVGLTAGANIEKEIFEEAGVRVAARRLYAVRHKASHDYDPDVRDFYKLFFLCEQLDDAVPEPGLETGGADFFTPDALPALSKGRVLEKDIVAAIEFQRDPTRACLFD